MPLQLNNSITIVHFLSYVLSRYNESRNAHYSGNSGGVGSDHLHINQGPTIE